ncbi:glucuronosyltransferase [Caenorhabditis elegans]|uniref:glucuronosyltransferase n=1 Tax=Caenorhabditis elegans TaxID=6239 RepID=D5MCT5_CAEEL|nr:glucuronosyltransferase [Caenorhabditis elegans]CBL43432.1 glucuronosyltransferase [Caenorhabditis elegans]|eukprot:NP_001255487.1 UDP-GlucuronosylTransferase [Caenorhabditis elegans]
MNFTICSFLLLILASFCFSVSNNIKGKKVLVYLPVTGHSHLKFMSTTSNILQEEGYNVTLLLPLIDITLNNTNIPIVKKIKHRINLDIHPGVMRTIIKMGGMASRRQTWTMGSGIYGFDGISHLLSDLYSNICDNIFHMPGLLDRLKAEKYEMGMSEPFFVCGFALFDHLGIDKIISVDSHIGLEGPKIAHGFPVTSSYLPAAFSESSDHMSFVERTRSLYETYLNRKFARLIHNKEIDAMKGVYKGKSTWEELMRLPAYMFTNSNPILDFPYPRPSKFIEIGGIAADEKKHDEVLPESYDHILNLRNRTVLISFGSNAKSIFMPDHMRRSLIIALGMMPDITFIWKYENSSIDIVKEFDPTIKNIVQVDWMPQQALLADPRLDLFVTHGGMASTNEIAFSGKPAVMVPVFGDQTRNSRMLERHGGVLMLRKENLEYPEIVIETILSVLNDPSYAERAQQLATLLRNHPESPKQVFLKYFNFVARFGKPTGIDSNSINVDFIAYYYLDLIAFLLIVAYFAKFLVSHVYSYFCYLRKEKAE